MRKSLERQLKEREWKKGLYCPNCEKKMPVIDSGYRPDPIREILLGMFGAAPRIYLCTGCNYEHDLSLGERR